MSAIERVTSVQRCVQIGTSKRFCTSPVPGRRSSCIVTGVSFTTVFQPFFVFFWVEIGTFPNHSPCVSGVFSFSKVWNETVATLTLMALGFFGRKNNYQHFAGCFLRWWHGTFVAIFFLYMWTDDDRRIYTHIWMVVSSISSIPIWDESKSTMFIICFGKVGHQPVQLHHIFFNYHDFFRLTRHKISTDNPVRRYVSRHSKHIVMTEVICTRDHALSERHCEAHLCAGQAWSFDHCALVEP